MKVLIINRALGTLFGGGESFDRNAARYLAKLGHKTTVITGKPLFHASLNFLDKLDVVYLSVPNLRHYAYVTAKTNRMLSAAFYHLDNRLFERRVMAWLATEKRFQNYDIVQHCGLFNLPRWILNRWQLPVVSWLPGPPSGLEWKAIHYLVRRPGFGLFTRGDPVSLLIKEGLVEGQDFVVIEPGVELERVDASTVDRPRMRRYLGVSDDSLFGVTVSRLVSVKNPFLLLRGVTAAVRKDLPLHWALIGDGPQRTALEREVQRLGMGGKIRFIGHCPNQEVHRFLAASDLFALTSYYENFSIAVLEAMAHRLPVVATNVGYIATLVRESGAGLLVPPEDEASLAQAIVSLARNPSLRQELGERGRAFVKQFDWPIIAGKLVSFYERVIRG